MESNPTREVSVNRSEGAESIEAYDTDLFERLKSIDVKILVNLKPDFEDLKRQKEEFLAGELDCPHFTYGRLDGVDLDSKEVQLQTLKNDLASDDYPEPIVRIYSWAINEQIAKVRMLKETKQMKNADESEHHALRFSTYSEFIYGEPKSRVFDSTLAIIKNKLDAIPSDSGLRNSDSLNLLCDMLGRVDRDLPEIPQMQAEQHGEVLDDIEEIVSRFEQGLDKYGLSEIGWTVVVSETEERDKIAVSQSEKKVKLPSQKAINNRSKARSLTEERINGLIEHEIGTHAVRAMNGGQSELKLLQAGLDRYDKGEEGLATFREQLEAGADDYAGFHGYFAAGLAKGLDNHNERNFAEVFIILKAYFEICESEDSEKAKELAWARALRTFRGTPGDVPGAIFTKDIVYREGNMAVHALNDDDLLDHTEANVGKYDITNKRHKAVLQEIGIDIK